MLKNAPVESNLQHASIWDVIGLSHNTASAQHVSVIAYVYMYRQGERCPMEMRQNPANMAYDGPMRDFGGAGSMVTGDCHMPQTESHMVHCLLILEILDAELSIYNSSATRESASAVCRQITLRHRESAARSLVK